jgi:prevent-host-death family protein
MSSVSVRDLRNHGGEVIDRVEHGESVVITRSGRPVAELRALRPRALDASTLLSRWRTVPAIDPEALRRDVDAVLDATL